MGFKVTAEDAIKHIKEKYGIRVEGLSTNTIKKALEVIKIKRKDR